MEHIVQFAIGIDDDAITKQVTANAEKVILNQISEEVKKVLFEQNWRGEYTGDLSKYAETQFEKLLEDNKDKIIELTSKYLADKLSRTKRGREIFDKFDV